MTDILHHGPIFDAWRMRDGHYFWRAMKGDEMTRRMSAAQLTISLVRSFVDWNIRSLNYFHSLNMEYFTSLSVSSSLIIGISHHIFLLACAPLPCVWTPGLPSPGPAPVPASLGADRGPGGLGLGPAPRQWTRLQRQGDNLPESHKNPDNTGFNIPRHRMGSRWSCVYRSPSSLPQQSASCHWMSAWPTLSTSLSRAAWVTPLL